MSFLSRFTQKPPEQEIDAQMAADSAEYDNPNQQPIEPPPEKKSFITSVRESFGEMTEKAKEDRRESDKERKMFEVDANAVKEQAKRKRKEAEKVAKIQKIYEQERNRRPFIQTAMSAAGRFRSASAGFSSRFAQTQPPQGRRDIIMGDRQAQPQPDFSVRADMSLLGGASSGGVPLMGGMTKHPRKSAQLKIVSLYGNTAFHKQSNKPPKKRGGVSSPAPSLFGKIGRGVPLMGKPSKRRGFF